MLGPVPWKMETRTNAETLSNITTWSSIFNTLTLCSEGFCETDVTIYTVQSRCDKGFGYDELVCGTGGRRCGDGAVP